MGACTIKTQKMRLIDKRHNSYPGVCKLAVRLGRSTGSHHPTMHLPAEAVVIAVRPHHGCWDSSGFSPDSLLVLHTPNPTLSLWV